ncbi:exodeoxyribonuclease VII large subunit [uncultured Desulfosarcina sp.]|uniref:exodeoxyribonuclease VII large subunit n=1 Tax=uncultured Desulfosarcina sp. TaxID=218289 RepID=UPI0029C6EDB7|nr:exodeoxyribonuclease VII large subunit [uncultured Desulfosarcina sp.]
MKPTIVADNPPQQHIYSISELNNNIKQLLEDKYPFLWISGEISNFRVPSSGHCYFTLKDARSQIGAVLFRNQAANLAFRPKDGMAVIGFGRVGVYEPRGSYQIVFEYMEPKGIGNLQIAFEKLKRQLAAEGLFDAQAKKQLPALPKTIAIVTSPTGAAVRDFIKVAHRRFSNLPLQVVPVPVQGESAPREIIRALTWLNEIETCDVIVLARGGGSIEDLWAFNDEQVARAIFASRIPVVSAIGHETDFTIADFVADLRAPTPSAAAEMVVPSKTELQNRLQEIKQKLYVSTISILKLLDKNIDGLHNRIVHPKRRLQDWRMRQDDLTMRLAATINDALARKNERVVFRREMLMQVSPAKNIATLRMQLATFQQAMASEMVHGLQDRRNSLAKNSAMLDAFNPMAILQRGYSITRSLPDRTIVRSADSVETDQQLEVVLANGKLRVTVTDKQTQ